ncbi:Gag-Pol polyprotein [Frankliniella fusca]|uniref:Gag-Pol polyprotein n=1 Tax=Frankliniella fusca TaxID=407009 RepID=A0AAE1HF27_9NEOP|nr:Gag-Pol polyprotein [Frankliniella fusca]
MASLAANIPAPLSFEGDVSSNWKKFHKNFKIYLGATGREKTVTELASLDAAQKREYYDSLGKLLLNIAGDEAITVSSSFGLSDEDEFNYIELVKKFEAYSAEDDNETYIRFMFNRTRQRDGETFDHFLTEVRKRVKLCKFGDLEDSFVRDRIVEGICDKKLQQSLLAIKDLDLKAAIKECRAAEASRRYAEEIQQELTSTLSVNAIKNQKQTRNQDKGAKFDCKRCGFNHVYGNCPAYGKTCMNCKGKNHFIKMCKKPKVVNSLHIENSDKNDYQVLFTDSIGIEVITLNSIGSKDSKPQEYRQNIKVGNKIINFKLDPGSPVSIITPEEVQALNIEESAIIPTNICIKPFGPDSPIIKAVGRVKVLTKVGGKTREVSYVIAPGEAPLFGIADCEEFGLIVRKVMAIDSIEHAAQARPKEEFIQKNSDVFEGLGKFPVPKSVKMKMQSQQKRTQEWYNKSAKRPDCEFQPGDPVIVNLGNKGETWKEATVIEKCKEPRSFVVQMKNGGEVRRATDHLRPDYQPSNMPEADHYYSMVVRRNRKKSPVVEERTETPERVQNITKERVVTPEKQEKTKKKSGSENKDKASSSNETIYQLLVPEWLFQENYVTKAGRVIKPTNKYVPT